MPDRKILVPIRDGKPDFFGVKVTQYRVTVNYRDVLKAIVTADLKTLDTLTKKSREHFARVWGREGDDDIIVADTEPLPDHEADDEDEDDDEPEPKPKKPAAPKKLAPKPAPRPAPVAAPAPQTHTGAFTPNPNPNPFAR